MTRKEIMNRLQELGIDNDYIESRCYQIKDFLYYNNARLKDITNIKLSENQSNDKENWEVLVELGDWGWVEI